MARCRAGGAAGEGVILSAASPAAEGSNIVWQASGSDLAGGFGLSAAQLGGLGLGALAVAAAGSGGGGMSPSAFLSYCAMGFGGTVALIAIVVCSWLVTR